MTGMLMFALVLGIPALFYQQAVARSIASDSVLHQNGLDAQQLNDKFSLLNETDSCTEDPGTTVCIKSQMARCVGDLWMLVACPAGTICVANPLTDGPGTIVVCDTDLDALARMRQAGINATSPADTASNTPSPTPTDAPDGGDDVCQDAGDDDEPDDMGDDDGNANPGGDDVCDEESGGDGDDCEEDGDGDGEDNDEGDDCDSDEDGPDSTAQPTPTADPTPDASPSPPSDTGEDTPAPSATNLDLPSASNTAGSDSVTVITTTVVETVYVTITPAPTSPVTPPPTAAQSQASLSQTQPPANAASTPDASTPPSSARENVYVMPTDSAGLSWAMTATIGATDSPKATPGSSADHVVSRLEFTQVLFTLLCIAMTHVFL